MVQNISFLEAGHTVQRTYFVDSTKSIFGETRFPSSVAVIEHAKEGVILFDTGYSTRFYDVAKRMPERLYQWMTPVQISEKDTAKAQLQAQGIQPRDVRHVVLSHFHADHVAGVSDFAQAKLHYSRTEYEALKRKSRLGQLVHAFLPALLPSDFEARHASAPEDLQEIPELSTESFEWRGQDLFGDGSVWTVPLPGHTQAHQGLFVRAPSKGYFLLGDAVWLLDSLKAKSYPSKIAQNIFYDAKEYQVTFDRLHELVHRKTEDPHFAMVPCHCHSALVQNKSAENGVAPTNSQESL